MLDIYFSHTSNLNFLGIMILIKMSNVTRSLPDWGTINEANYVRDNEGQAKIFQISRITGLIKPSKIDGEFLL